LSRQGQASQYEAEKKSACPSIAKLPPTREERRDEEPDCGRETWWPKKFTTRRVLRRKKASWLPRRRSSSRRASRRGPRSVRRTEGVSILPKQHVTRRRPRGARRAGRRVAISLPSQALPTNGRVGPSLEARRPTHTRHCRLNHPRRNRRWVSWCRLARGAMKSGGPWRFTLRRSLLRFEKGVAGVVWLAARSALEREGGYRMPRTPTKRAREAGADATAQGGNALTAGGERRGLGRSRSCSRVVLVVAEVVSWSFGAKKRAFSTSSDLESVRGQAPSVRSDVRKHGRSGAKGHQSWIEAETIT